MQTPILLRINEMNLMKKIKRPATIVVSTQFQYAGSDNAIKFSEAARGSLYQTECDTHILAYDSMLDGKKRTTTMKIMPEKVSVIGIGDFHSRQHFAQGLFHTETYHFAGMALTFRVLTLHVNEQIDFENGYAEILMNYELYTGEDLVQTVIKAITIDCD